MSGLSLTITDEPGFWQRNGYHDRGDPWVEQRHHDDRPALADVLSRHSSGRLLDEIAQQAAPPVDGRQQRGRRVLGDRLRNAVRYRVQRAFDVLGIEEDDADQRLFLHLACRAQRLATSAHRPCPVNLRSR
jgi:hypothetical protein